MHKEKQERDLGSSFKSQTPQQTTPVAVSQNRRLFQRLVSRDNGQGCPKIALFVFLSLPFRS